MPFVNVYYPEELIKIDELSKISECIHHSLIQEFNVPADDYFHMFFPYLKNHFYYNTRYLIQEGKLRSEKMLYISITCGPGRSFQQKKDLYQSIANSICTNTNILSPDIFITLTETPAENWSFGQGIAQFITTEEESDKNE